MSARRGLAVIVAMMVALLIPAGAQAHLISGVVGDVPSGYHAHITSLPMRETDLPYDGGPVLHSNRTHPIFWEPAGSALT
ncbi:MAG TPA: hypothetical protein VLV28_10445, partial [Gaiellaceae bacterium]|nr:hypothetical protein [Gaiellaceae bacterium]